MDRGRKKMMKQRTPTPFRQRHLPHPRGNRGYLFPGRKLQPSGRRLHHRSRGFPHFRIPAGNLPRGKYWNHMGVEDWDELTVTDTPCQHDVYVGHLLQRIHRSHPRAVPPNLNPWNSAWGLRRCSVTWCLGKTPPFPPSPITSSCVWATTSVWNFPTLHGGAHRGR